MYSRNAFRFAVLFLAHLSSLRCTIAIKSYKSGQILGADPHVIYLIQSEAQNTVQMRRPGFRSHEGTGPLPRADPRSPHLGSHLILKVLDFLFINLIFFVNVM